MGIEINESSLNKSLLVDSPLWNVSENIYTREQINPSGLQDFYTDSRENAIQSNGSTFFRALLNGMNVLSGVGILSTPYAFSQGGWIGLSILFVVAALCCYTGILLQRCMGTSSHIRSYPDIGEAAFGPKGRFFVAAFIYAELYAFSVALLILEGDNLAQLFPKMRIAMIWGTNINSRQTFVVVSAVIILPTVWLRKLDLLAFISAFGVAACVVVVFAVGWVGVFEGVDFHHSGQFINPSGLPVAIGLYTFCYAGHAVFPTMYSSMRDRTRFSQVLILSFLLCTLIYASIGVMGYMMFGDNLVSQVTLNLPKSAIASKLAIYTTLITPFAKYAVIVNPLAVALEELKPPSISALKTWSICIRTLLVVSTVTVALAVPLFGYFMALTGSLLSTSISIIIPCACYLKIFCKRHSMFELAVMVIVLSVEIVASVVGTYSSVENIAHNLTS